MVLKQFFLLIFLLCGIVYGDSMLFLDGWLYTHDHTTFYVLYSHTIKNCVACKSWPDKLFPFYVYLHLWMEYNVNIYIFLWDIATTIPCHQTLVNFQWHYQQKSFPIRATCLTDRHDVRPYMVNFRVNKTAFLKKAISNIYLNCLLSSSSCNHFSLLYSYFNKRLFLSASCTQHYYNTLK